LQNRHLARDLAQGPEETVEIFDEGDEQACAHRLDLRYRKTHLRRQTRAIPQHHGHADRRRAVDKRIHERVVDVGPRGGAAETLVAEVEELLAGLLVAEKLYDLHPVDPLGKEGVDRRQSFANLDEELPQSPPDDLEHREE